MVEVIRTIEQIQKASYGLPRRFLRKADDPMLSTSAGAYNAIYGAYVWINANLESNAFGVLPKYDWLNSGFRVIKSKVTSLTGTGISSLGGTSENGNIADAVKPDMVLIDTKPKQMQFPIMTSYINDLLVNKAKDDNWGSLSQQALWAGVQFKELINLALLADVQAQAAGGGAFGGVDHFESLDRLISSDAEEDAVGGTGSGWYDPYASTIIDRDTGTDFDSTIKSASGSTIDSANGVLTDYLLRDFKNTIHKNSGRLPTCFLTEEDTLTEIEAQYNGQVEYNVLGEQLVELGVNGVRSMRGSEVGITVSSIFKVPVIVAKDATKYATDTEEIGRLFALSTDDPEGFGYPRLGIQILDPIKMFPATADTPGFPHVVGKWGEKAVYSIVGQTICRNFKPQGKIRDIKKS